MEREELRKRFYIETGLHASEAYPSKNQTIYRSWLEDKLLSTPQIDWDVLFARFKHDPAFKIYPKSIERVFTWLERQPGFQSPVKGMTEGEIKEWRLNQHEYHGDELMLKAFQDSLLNKDK